MFVQVKVRIAEAEKAILDCQQALDVAPSESSLLEPNRAKSSLHNWLKIESDLWKQRSKIRWLQDGDRNTKFFHQSAKSKGVLNRIDKISINDSTFSDEGQIRDQAMLFFSNWLQSPPTTPSEYLF